MTPQGALPSARGAIPVPVYRRFGTTLADSMTIRTSTELMRAAVDAGPLKPAPKAPQCAAC